MQSIPRRSSSSVIANPTGPPPNDENRSVVLYVISLGHAREHSSNGKFCLYMLSQIRTFMARPLLEVQSFRLVLPIRRTITTGYAIRAEPRKRSRRNYPISGDENRWAILADLKKYPEWNPVRRGVKVYRGFDAEHVFRRQPIDTGQRHFRQTEQLHGSPSVGGGGP
jgi:hypothetical protein